MTALIITIIVRIAALLFFIGVGVYFIVKAVRSGRELDKFDSSRYMIGEQSKKQ